MATKQKAKAGTNDSVLKLEWRDPRSIAPNPKNARKHPARQRRAFADLYDEVGWVGALIYNERTKRLIDGHLRLQEAIERNMESVPVLVCDIDETKENLALLFRDRVGEIAEWDIAMQNALAESVDVQSEDLAALLGVNGDDSDDGGAVKKADIDDKHQVGLVAGEHYDYVVLLCRTKNDHLALTSFLGLGQERSAFSPHVALGRAAWADKILEAIERVKDEPE